MTLEEVLKGLNGFSERAWLYLPRAGGWNLATMAAVLESDEIPEEEEDLPEAGVPEFAKANDLKQVLPITVVQDIVANLKLFVRHQRQQNRSRLSHSITTTTLSNFDKAAPPTVRFWGAMPTSMFTLTQTAVHAPLRSFKLAATIIGCKS